MSTCGHFHRLTRLVIRFARLCLLAVCALPLFAQLPASLQVTNVYNITNSTQVFDNRSITRQCNNTTFAVVSGIGSWSVQLEYADAGASGPWTSFGSGGTVTASAPLAHGAGFGFHNFFRLNTTVGTTVANLSCEKDFYLAGSGGGGSGGGTPGGNPGDFQVNVANTSFGGVTPPIPTNLGGTGTVNPFVTCNTGVVCTGTWPNVTIQATSGPPVYTGTPFQEVPSGTVNGTNPTFTLTNTPNTATLILTVNGVVQKPSADFTLSGATITFLSGAIPQTGALLQAFYQYGNSVVSGNAITVNGAAVPPNAVGLTNSLGQIVDGAAWGKNVGNKLLPRDEFTAMDYGNGSTNGIASAITAAGTTVPAEVLANPAYPTTEAMPGQTTNWYTWVGGVPVSTSANITACDQRYGPWWCVAVNQIGNNVGGSQQWGNINLINNKATFWTTQGAYTNVLGLALIMDNQSGGINTFPNKTNYSVLQAKTICETEGQCNGVGLIINHGGMGDAVNRLISECNGGVNAGNDEGCEAWDVDVGQHGGSYAAMISAISGLTLSLTVTQLPSTQGEGRNVIDLNGSHTITAGHVSFISPSASAPTTVTFTGTTLPAATVQATLGTAVPNPSNYTTPVTVTPNTFTTGSFSSITTSSKICVADTGSSPSGGWEIVQPTSVSAPSFSAVFRKQHTAAAAIQIGGLCGYGLDFTADDMSSANWPTTFPAGNYTPTGTVRRIWPVISNTSTTAYIFNGYGGLWNPFASQWQNSSSFWGYVLYPMSVATQVVNNYCIGSDSSCNGGTHATPDTITVEPSPWSPQVGDTIEETLGPVIRHSLGFNTQHSYMPCSAYTACANNIFFAYPIQGVDQMWTLNNIWTPSAYTNWTGANPGTLAPPLGISLLGVHSQALFIGEPASSAEIQVNCPPTGETCTKTVNPFSIQNVTTGYDNLGYFQNSSQWQFTSGVGNTGITLITPDASGAGSGYSIGDTYAINATGASGATGVVEAISGGGSTGPVTRATVNGNHGTGYTLTGSQTQTLTGMSSGLRVIITGVSGGAITSLIPVAATAPQGYSAGNTIAVQQPPTAANGTATIATVDGSGRPLTLTVLTGGTGYVQTPIPTTTTLTGTGSGLKLDVLALEVNQMYFTPQWLITPIIRPAANTYALTVGCTAELQGTQTDITDSTTFAPGGIITGGGLYTVTAFCAPGNHWTVMGGYKPSGRASFVNITGGLSLSTVCSQLQCPQGQYLLSVPTVIDSTGTSGTINVFAQFGDGATYAPHQVATITDSGTPGSVVSNVVAIYSDGSQPIGIYTTYSGTAALASIDKGDYGTGIATLTTLESQQMGRADVHRALLKAYLATGSSNDAMREVGLLVKADLRRRPTTPKCWRTCATPPSARGTRPTRPSRCCNRASAPWGSTSCTTSPTRSGPTSTLPPRHARRRLSPARRFVAGGPPPSRSRWRSARPTPARRSTCSCPRPPTWGTRGRSPS